MAATAKTMIFTQVISLLQPVITKTPVLNKIPLFRDASFLMMALPFALPFAGKTLKCAWKTLTYPFRSNTKKKEEKIEHKHLAAIGKELKEVHQRLDLLEGKQLKPEIKTKTEHKALNNITAKRFGTSLRV